MEENNIKKPKALHLGSRNVYFPDREITCDNLKFVCYMIERTARRITDEERLRMQTVLKMVQAQSGDVMYPNTVAYREGKGVKYYINQAGGWGNRAKKSHTYIIYSLNC